MAIIARNQSFRRKVSLPFARIRLSLAISPPTYAVERRQLPTLISLTLSLIRDVLYMCINETRVIYEKSVRCSPLHSVRSLKRVYCISLFRLLHLSSIIFVAYNNNERVVTSPSLFLSKSTCACFEHMSHFFFIFCLRTEGQRIHARNVREATLHPHLFNIN